MNAIELLEAQHFEVEGLFDKLRRARSGRMPLFNQIADALAIHGEIEERIFYPAVKAPQTEEILEHSLEEHMQVKWAIAEIMGLDENDEEFRDRCRDLADDVQHHVAEERHELFPKVRKLFGEEKLDELGDEMEQMVKDLFSEGAPVKPRELAAIESTEPPQQI
jgi:hemerythrin superfamily protein